MKNISTQNVLFNILVARIEQNIHIGLPLRVTQKVVNLRSTYIHSPSMLKKMAKQWATAPAMQIDTKASYEVNMETSKGLIVIELYPSFAPITVNNFVFLINEGFYDGVSFHRVISNFVVQGGDPTGTGAGGPGYRFQDEFVGNPLRHERGVISMANAGPNTNGSQFFLTHSPQPHLDGRHTVFGKIIQGLDVLDAIRQGDKMIAVSIR